MRHFVLLTLFLSSITRTTSFHLPKTNINIHHSTGYIATRNTRRLLYNLPMMSATSNAAAVQDTARQILDSFSARDYKAPWWARNKHVNTIVGALFCTPPIPAYRRERWDTEDGDFVDIDFLDSETKPSRGIALLYHGLESNTNAPLTVRQAISLSKAGFDVAAVSFRGCSGEDNRTPGAYHLGFTKDIR
jgi:predicted alpha/beta-fold hydrolase